MTGYAQDITGGQDPQLYENKKRNGTVAVTAYVIGLKSWRSVVSWWEEKDHRRGKKKTKGKIRMK